MNEAGRVGKATWPLIGLIVMAIITTLQDAFTDEHIHAQEWVLVVFQALMAFNVWATANLPGYHSMKTYVAAAIAVVSALHVFIIGGVSIQELMNLGIVALSAVGVTFTKQPITTVMNGETIRPTDHTHVKRPVA